jgi:hypothetical protein
MPCLQEIMHFISSCIAILYLVQNELFLEYIFVNVNSCCEPLVSRTLSIVFIVNIMYNVKYIK